MKFLCVFLLCCLPFTGAAKTDSAIFDGVRKMLDEADVNGLEQTFKTLHEQSLETRDFSVLRDLNGSLFATTHPVRRETIKLWTEAYPSSTYAQAASFWMHQHIAWIYRGSGSFYNIPYRAAEQFQSETGKAIDAAFLSVKGGFDYAPAADAAAKSFLYHRSNLTVSSLLDNVFETIPNQHTLKIAIQTESPQWGGSVKAVKALCAKYAPMIEGYDAETCMIQAVLNKMAIEDRSNWSEELAAAFAAYEARVDQVPAAFALDYMLDTMTMPTDQAEVLRLREYLETGYDIRNRLGDYMQLASFLAPQDSVETYLAAQEAKIRGQLELNLKDDPLNPGYLTKKIYYVMDERNVWKDDGSFSIARELWNASVEYGGLDPSTWQLGASIERKRAGKFFGLHRHPYLVNIFLTSNKPGLPLFDVLQNLVEAYAVELKTANESGGVAFTDKNIARLRCPMIQAMRLMSYACENGIAEAGICTPKEAGFYINYVRDDLEKNAGCPVVVSQNVEDLLYQPISVDELDSWRQSDTE